MPRRLLSCTAVTAALTLVGGCGLGATNVESATDAGERGPISFVTSDTSGIVPTLIKRWNDKHPREKVTFIELPEDADQQRQMMIQNAQLKTDTYTVLNLDVVWTSEFAANRWIDELPADSFPFDKTLGPINDTAKYRGKWFAMPYASDGAMLYYRKDLLEKAGVEEPPKTWDEMREICDKVLGEQKSKMSCYGGQFEKYEGLTVNFSEAINSAGGQVTDAKGIPHLDTPEAERGMDKLVKSFKDGTIPKDGITFMEEQGRRAFEKGNLLFYRNWPYQYAISDKKAKNNEVAGKFGVAPIPGEKGPGASSLGGHNLALSSTARNKATALDFMRFMTNEESSRLKLEKASLAPVYTKLYDEPEYVRKFPYLPVLKKSISGAEPRPRVVQYGDATKAVQNAAYNALTGKQSSAAALRNLQRQLRELAP
ncbi:ABC transporter substrate-binding protein [Streptomyces abyssalis]|uniref:ABC transporter substrate-binding protein n=1 Tax=Streptomyces abyssalis TaxID=933944 RepID=A0A1E7JRB5_9ACTN|nr:ABC transporter substrate-binding protein [Streptomyces abyssalis]OEU95414.1 ABC transporter substrate-binding protein [Streptomyces abyssalis]OEV13887.1 ABC transporter substrate-binding protein [Streptomyces nanshensis]